MSAAPEQDPPTGPGPRLADSGRVAAFSDGVFAIVITLLVLDLRVPDFHEGDLAESLLEEAPSFLAFTVSFIYIGVLWLNHHAVIRLVRGTTLALNWINLALLFGVVVIPFPTAVLAAALTDGDRNDQTCGRRHLLGRGGTDVGALAGVLRVSSPPPRAARRACRPGPGPRAGGAADHRAHPLRPDRTARLDRESPARPGRHRRDDHLSRCHE
ncbi:DUF1211 domain-containing protein [Micromonospora sp. STR1_7]|uniref:DUF1211 domain-containing protein n=1 Tax=Micromonospora parastrephiae TaxID=2806101 RepID=A0ABS1XMR2_9ACTN|nr:DUF1211 domain-containing protein [Micromonospora parastrephiae]